MRSMTIRTLCNIIHVLSFYKEIQDPIILLCSYSHLSGPSWFRRSHYRQKPLSQHHQFNPHGVCWGKQMNFQVSTSNWTMSFRARRKCQPKHHLLQVMVSGRRESPGSSTALDKRAPSLVLVHPICALLPCLQLLLCNVPDPHSSTASCSSDRER